MAFSSQQYEVYDGEVLNETATLEALGRAGFSVKYIQPNVEYYGSSFTSFMRGSRGDTKNFFMRELLTCQYFFCNSILAKSGVNTRTFVERHSSEYMTRIESLIPRFFQIYNCDESLLDIEESDNDFDYDCIRGFTFFRAQHFFVCIEILQAHGNLPASL